MATKNLIPPTDILVTSLVNNNVYTVLPNGTPVNLGASPTGNSINASGLSLGFGLWQAEPSHRVVSFHITGSFTATGAQANIYTIQYPFTANMLVSAVSTIPANIPLSGAAGGNLIVAPVAPGAAGTDGGAAGNILLGKTFLPVIFATTWTSGTLTISCDLI